MVKLGVSGEGDVKGALASTRREISATKEAANMAMASMHAGALRVAGAMAAIGVGASALDAAATFDAMKRGIATQVSSAKELDAVYKEIRKTSLMPGIDMKQASNAFLQLRAVGFATEEAHDATRQLANALASVGGSASQMENVVRAISQMAGKAKLSQEEVNQLTENLPTMGAVIQQAFGTRSTEAIEKMGITGAQAARRILEIMRTMPRASAGIRTEMEAAADSFQQMQVSLGMLESKFLRLFGPSIMKGMDSMAKFFDAVPNYSKAIATFAGVLGGAYVGGKIFALIGWITKLGVAIRSIGIAAAISEALATGGLSVPGAIAGAVVAAGAGIAIGVGVDKALGMTSQDIPTTGGQTFGGAPPSIAPIGGVKPVGQGPFEGGSWTGAEQGQAFGLAGRLRPSLMSALIDGMRGREQWLGEIAHNTRRTFEALDLRAETTGGGALARQGVTGAEQRRRMEDTMVSRFAGATSIVGGNALEREIRKVTADEIRRRRSGNMRRG